MKLTIELDIEGAIAQALQPEKLQPILDKHITEAIESAIRDSTGYRSPFRKALEEQLSQVMPHGLREADVAKFQHVLNEAVRQAVQCSHEDAVTTALKKAVDLVMPDVPAVMKMSDLVKLAREGFHKGENEAFYAYFESSHYSDGGGRLYLDENEKPGDSVFSSSHKSREDRKYQASYQIAFGVDGHVYALRLDGKQITPSARPDIVGSFDAVLMAMYVGRTKLEVDADDEEVAYEASDKSD